MIDVIFCEEQYLHKEVMHFLTSSTIKELASCDFLKSLIKIDYKNGSIAFFKASHIYARVIIAFFDKVDLKDSTSFKTSGIIAGKFSYKAPN